MKCSKEVKDQVKQAIIEVIKNNTPKIGTVAPNGESFAYTDKFFRNLLKNTSDLQAVVDSVKEKADNEEAMFHKQLRKHLGEEVSLSFANNSSRKYFVVASNYIENVSNPNDSTVTLKVSPVDNLNTVQTYTFKVGRDTSEPTSRNTRVKVRGLGDSVNSAIRSYDIAKFNENKAESIAMRDKVVPEIKETLRKMKQVNDVLGSRHNSDTLEGYEKVKDYKHGDIESMKEILNKLHVLGNSKASNEHLRYLNELFESMHPKFFNEMDLYLKENGVESLGQVRLNTDEIFIEVGKRPKNKVYQSEAEVYAHEVVHTMVAWALRQKNVDISDIRLKLNFAMKEANKKTTWKDFLDVEESKATNQDIARAKELQEYVFSSENNLEEFIAHTLTNPVVMKVMKDITLKEERDAPKTAFERIGRFFSDMLNMISGNFTFKTRDFNVFEQVHSLSFQLGEVNNKHQDILASKNALGSMMEVLNSVDQVAANKLEEIRKKLSNEDKTIKVPKKEDGLIVNAKFFLELLYKGITNPIYRGYIGLWASANYIKPEGTAREFLRGLFTPDETARLVEMVNLLSNNIDTVRNSQINAANGAIKSAFKEKLRDEADISITRAILDTNLGHLKFKSVGRKQYSDGEMIKLLTDEGYRKDRERIVKNKIAKLLKDDEGRKNWTINQALGMGYFMATHLRNVVQNTNAMNIAKGINTQERYKTSQELVVAIDELASIHALKHTDQKQKDIVAELFKTEKEGINTVLDFYEGFKNESRKLSFKDDEIHMMTGYSKEIFDDGIDIEIAPISKRSELEKLGYTFKYQLTPKNGDSYSQPMALFLTSSWGKNERMRATVGLGKLHARGTSMRNLKLIDNPETGQFNFERDLAKINLEALKLNELMKSDSYNVTEAEFGMAPIHDAVGNVIDYRYNMSKKQKEELLGQDVRVTEVLPKSMGTLIHRIQREELNERALQLIKEDMKNNWKEGEIGEDGFSEYTVIRANSPDPKIRDLYRMLPASYQRFIESRKDKSMAVRSDLMLMYFGYKHFKLTDIGALKVLPKQIRTLIDTVEGVWMELIKLSKVAILLKMPIILIANLLSNIIYAISTGSNPATIVKDYISSFRNVNEYIKNNRRANKLEIEIKRDKESLNRVRNSRELSDKIRQKEIELTRLRKVLDNNDLKELFDAGMYQAIVEDVERTTLNETNLIVKGINSKLNKMPAAVRYATDIAYLTQNTAWYKVSQEVLQRSDLVARDVQNKRQKKLELDVVNGIRDMPKYWTDSRKDKSYPKRKKLVGAERTEFLDMARNQRMEGLIDSFVNYTKPNSNFEEYLNRIGLLMFTKYFKRIQRVVLQSGADNPIKTSMSVLAAGALLNMDIIQDQLMFTKGFGYDGDFGLSNIVPIYSPLYHLENLIVPPLFKEELRMGIF